jgi:hypothetical protein
MLTLVLMVAFWGILLSSFGRGSIRQCFDILWEGSDSLQIMIATSRHNNAVLQQMVDRRKRGQGPYANVTGSTTYQEPELSSTVREKTIWSYWYDPEECPSSEQCEYPLLVQLCVETVQKNKGSFDHVVVHRDEVDKYVSRMDLPFRWNDLKPMQQKDALMNALLARYGGVALDISALLLRPIDDYWEEMVRKAATFRGYMYRLNGQPWRHAEVSSVWFLMSRREGIFSQAVQNQVSGMGDDLTTDRYHHSYLALGDQTLLPILEKFNYSFPKCIADETVGIVDGPQHVFPDQNPDMCPENEEPAWFEGPSGRERNDAKLLLRDPRDGPQLPFAFLGMANWHVDSAERAWDSSAVLPGSPMWNEPCDSSKQCWEDVFMARYRQEPKEGEAALLSFVKMFHHGNDMLFKTREEVFADNRSYLCNWLKIAGITK